MPLTARLPGHCGSCCITRPNQDGPIHGTLENSIHDIDLCLWYTQDRVRNVRAFTRNIQGGATPDINWSFLEFEGEPRLALRTTG
jgi:hypothetical protein